MALVLERHDHRSGLEVGHDPSRSAGDRLQGARHVGILGDGRAVAIVADLVLGAIAVLDLVEAVADRVPAGTQAERIREIMFLAFRRVV